ncbi:MAG: hypothetical protein MJY75_06355 [Bacteroidaceae bacterium]|nr:hypothetical protein [Bacteroidaceae bacterium]
MKKFMFAVAAVMVSTLSFAQGFGGGFGGGMPQGGFGGGQQMEPEERAKMQADRLKEQLTLTDAQYDSVFSYYVANAKEQAKRREEMQNGGGMPQDMDMQAMMEQMQKQREAQEKKLKSYLTEDQIKKYDEAQAARREQMQQNGGGFGGGFGGGMPQGGFGGGFGAPRN